MSGHRSAGILAGVAFLLIAGLGPAFSQDSSSGLQVRPVHPGIIETKPLNTITLVFCAVNRSGKAHEFTARPELPEGWRLVIEETDFLLAAGDEAIRLLSANIPVRTAMGSYKVGYTVSALDEPALSGRAEVEVKVLLQAELAVETLEVQHLAVAGEKCQSTFLVSNRSNAPLDVNLDVRSNGPGVSQDAKKIRLESGESKSVEISVATDPNLIQKLDQQVQLTAEAKIPEKGAIAASAMTEFEVIPRVSGKGDYFNRLPTEIGFSAIGGSGAQGYGQFNFSGAGPLNSEGTQWLDFALRGPGRGLGRDLTYPFGLQPDEYRVSYHSDNLNILAGDGSYSLTPLTEIGNYGRGLGVDATFNTWSVRGYFERVLPEVESSHEQALQVGWKPAEHLKFDLSYISREDPEHPKASQIFSLRSRLSNKIYHVNLEYSWDWSSVQGFRPANSALWLEAGETYKKLISLVNIIRAGAQYQGYYQNMDYDSAEVTYASSERWGVRASYRDQKIQAAIAPYIEPFNDETIQIGAYYQAFRRLSFSLDERIHDSRDLSGQSTFDYQDSTLRLGAFFYSGTFSLQNFVDIGRTLNNLSHDCEGLTEYTISANYLAINRISLAAYLHYRDQRESFTGDKIRRLDMNFQIGLQWKGINLNAFYRTAVLQDLYSNALSRENFEDPAFLLNNCDTFGINLACRFRNGHSLALRLQKVVNPFWDAQPPKALIGLVSYSIPVGFPVSRKMSIGMLHGRVYDVERNRQGIPGVIVKVNDLATVTDGKGEFVFNGLTPGLYMLTLDERRAGSDKVPVDRMPLNLLVEGGKKLDCPIGLTSGASISGRIMVYDFENGTSLQIVKKEPDIKAPSAGESVEKAPGDEAKPHLAERAPLVGTVVELRGEGEVYERVTDAEGRFLFEGLRPGPYKLRVYDDNLPEFHVFEKDTFDLDLMTGAQDNITIRVIPVIRSIQIIDQGEVKIKKKNDKVQ